MRRMPQAKYEAKKARLKLIVEEIRLRMNGKGALRGSWATGHWCYVSPSRLSYGELVDLYHFFHQKSKRFRGLI